jgi:hypothetical protein
MTYADKTQPGSHPKTDGLPPLSEDSDDVALFLTSSRTVRTWKVKQCSSTGIVHDPGTRLRVVKDYWIYRDDHKSESEIRGGLRYRRTTLGETAQGRLLCKVTTETPVGEHVSVEFRGMSVVAMRLELLLTETSYYHFDGLALPPFRSVGHSPRLPV